MSVNSDISVWYMGKGLPDYRPGMDLGKPDKVIAPPSFLEKGPVRPTVIKNPSSERKPRKHGGGKRKKVKATREEYLQLRNSGMTREQIAAQYGVALDTLKHHLTVWGVGKRVDELAAMKEIRN